MNCIDNESQYVKIPKKYQFVNIGFFFPYI